MGKLEPSHTALLMIDMQWGFIHPDSSLCIHGAEASIPACADVLRIARVLGLPIYHIRRRYSYDGSDVEPVRKSIWLQGGRPLCTEGAHPHSVEPPLELAEMPGETVIFKPRFSAFFETGLHEILQREHIDTVVLIGTTTPNCIRSTCYDALSYNYNVVIVEDATSSRTEQVQRANIDDMDYIGAEITDSRSFAAIFGI